MYMFRVVVGPVGHSMYMLRTVLGPHSVYMFWIVVRLVGKAIVIIHVEDCRGANSTSSHVQV